MVETTTNNDTTSKEGKDWSTYWLDQDQPWRKEPLISEERQKLLQAHCEIKPDIKAGIYPFKDIALTRADIEFLLSDLPEGPVFWAEEMGKKKKRDGVDFRGANLTGLNLSLLPLCRCLFGLDWKQWKQATGDQRRAAAATLRQANLWGAELQNVRARGVDFTGANMAHVYAQAAHLHFANLTGCDLHGGRFEGAEMEGVVLYNEQGIGPVFLDATGLGKVDLTQIDWSGFHTLGDEVLETADRMQDLVKAKRACRQMALVLRNQDVTEIADVLSYRSKVLARQVFRRRKQHRKYLFSLFAEAVSGYGYHPERVIVSLLLFATAYSALYFWLSGGQITLEQALLSGLATPFGLALIEPRLPHSDAVLWVTYTQLLLGWILLGMFAASGMEKWMGKD